MKAVNLSRTHAVDLADDIKSLKKALADSKYPDRDVPLSSCDGPLTRVLEELESLRRAQTAAREESPVVVRPASQTARASIGRLIKTPPSSGPITGTAIVERMLTICGCMGKYDCDCVSVKNQASRELWSEHNQRAKAA